MARKRQELKSTALESSTVRSSTFLHRAPPDHPLSLASPRVPIAWPEIEAIHSFCGHTTRKKSSPRIPSFVVCTALPLDELACLLKVSRAAPNGQASATKSRPSQPATPITAQRVARTERLPFSLVAIARVDGRGAGPVGLVYRCFV